MNSARQKRVIALLALCLIVAVALVGCGGKKEPKAAQSSSGATALGTLQSARSALSTMAPDAKLLVVQTAQTVTATGTPVWGYIFGSPSTDKTYLVYATGGRTMGVQEYGTAGLKKDDWSKVPSTYDWKYDSDDAYKKALETTDATGTPTGWGMGLVTYKPVESTATIEALVWNVWFAGGVGDASSAPIEVDAQTGETKKAAK